MANQSTVTPTHAAGQLPLETSEGTVTDRDDALEELVSKGLKLKEARKRADEKYKEHKVKIGEALTERAAVAYNSHDNPGQRIYHRRSEKYNTGVEPVDEVKGEDSE